MTDVGKAEGAAGAATAGADTTPGAVQDDGIASTPPKDRRNRRRSLVRQALVGAIVSGLALTILLAGRGIATSVDDLIARLERSEHVTRHRLGLTLRGMPDLSRLEERLAEAGFKIGDPLLVRIFKRESELELWMQDKSGRFRSFATYPICKWSGELGPKLRQGDRQAPEGFYTVARHQLNPNSRWHRSFNIGYPNSFDRSHGRTGDFIMVHGGCSSIGCFAVTDEAVDEIWRLVTAALKAGQERFQVQIYPFRMTAWNLALHRDSDWQSFWQDLKAGYDAFERTGVPPRVSVCNKRYIVAEGSLGSDGSAPIDMACTPVAEEASGQKL